MDESLDFFVRFLGATVEHRDPSGYVNLDWFGTQLTLTEDAQVSAPAGLHFGFNLDLETFERMARALEENAAGAIAMQPQTVDAGTPRERRKMYVRCPSGYLIELKGFAPD